MDKRITYKVVIDTETCPLVNSNEVRPENMFAYDIGYAIIDKRGKVYLARSFVNADIFLYERDLMNSAYYADKIPTYWEDIKSGKRVLARLSTILKIFYEDCKTYGVTEFYAHNMRFDYGALNNTIRWVTKSDRRYFFPYGAEICDTLKMARDILSGKKSYIRFCKNNSYLTANGKPRFTAEIIYRFITGDNEFIESHTGLEDVIIEKEILAYCYRQHKAMRRKLWE